MKNNVFSYLFLSLSIINSSLFPMPAMAISSTYQDITVSTYIIKDNVDNTALSLKFDKQSYYLPFNKDNQKFAPLDAKIEITSQDYADSTSKVLVKLSDSSHWCQDERLDGVSVHLSNQELVIDNSVDVGALKDYADGKKLDLRINFPQITNSSNNVIKCTGWITLKAEVDI